MSIPEMISPESSETLNGLTPKTTTTTSGTQQQNGHATENELKSAKTMTELNSVTDSSNENVNNESENNQNNNDSSTKTELESSSLLGGDSSENVSENKWPFDCDRMYNIAFKFFKGLNFFD